MWGADVPTRGPCASSGLRPPGIPNFVKLSRVAKCFFQPLLLIFTPCCAFHSMHEHHANVRPSMLLVQVLIHLGYALTAPPCSKKTATEAVVDQGPTENLLCCWIHGRNELCKNDSVDSRGSAHIRVYQRRKPDNKHGKFNQLQQMSKHYEASYNTRAGFPATLLRSGIF